MGGASDVENCAVAGYPDVERIFGAPPSDRVRVRLLSPSPASVRRITAQRC